MDEKIMCESETTECAGLEEPGRNEAELSRDIREITDNIKFFKKTVTISFLQIGHLLIEAKGKLKHGEWLPWLRDEADFSEATAQRFMRLAREYGKSVSVTDLGLTKALKLLALPDAERREFMEETHEVNGEEKTVYQMSRRELEQAIRERDEARAERDKALQDAEGSVLALAEKDSALEDAQGAAMQLKQELEAYQDKAAKAADAAEETIRALQEELDALREAPKEVAIEKVVDEEAVKAAADAARAEAEQALQKKLEKAKADKEKAEQEKAKAEQNMAALKAAQAEAEAVAAQEKKAMEENLESLRKKLAVASSSEVVVFKLHFEQGQTSVNKMNECITKMEQAGDEEGAGKLRAALRAMLTAALEAIA